MEFCYDISFPALRLTSPGTYRYTMRELTSADGNWETDPRAYPVVITVTDSGPGGLTAAVTYPQGFPIFVNTHHCEGRPPTVCGRFVCLPFPMYWFAPPQRAEYTAVALGSPVIEWWESVREGMAQ